MLTRLTESIDLVRCGWITSSGGVATSIVVSVSQPQLEIVLRVLVLAFTLLTLILTTILQIRALRKP
jgi:hypothetical protein